MNKSKLFIHFTKVLTKEQETKEKFIIRQEQSTYVIGENKKLLYSKRFQKKEKTKNLNRHTHT